MGEWGLGPSLREWGTSPGSPAGFLGSSGRGKCPRLLSCFSGLEGPSCLPLLISPTSLLCPQDQCGRGDVEALGGRGPAWELSRLPRPEWVGQSPLASVLLLPEGPSHLPLLISPASGVPILSGLYFFSPLSPPTYYWFTWGFLPSPRVSGPLASRRQAP